MSCRACIGHACACGWAEERAAIAAASKPGATTAAPRASGCASWPTVEEGPRVLEHRDGKWVAIAGGGPLLWVEGVAS